MTYRYTLAGRGRETWRPAFGYGGFRYVQVSGLDGLPRRTRSRPSRSTRPSPRSASSRAPIRWSTTSTTPRARAC
ncbi:family 78 glycoside hydrolase catalytic domain [Caulobacter segnis]